MYRTTYYQKYLVGGIQVKTLSLIVNKLYFFLTDLKLCILSTSKLLGAQIFIKNKFVFFITYILSILKQILFT